MKNGVGTATNSAHDSEEYTNSEICNCRPDKYKVSATVADTVSMMEEPSPKIDFDPSSKELERIKLLSRYAVLDTEAESDLDRFAAMAAQVCHTPIALISLVDVNRQWFKSKVGLDTTETPRSQSFCAHALDRPELLIVPDATLEERFASNPLVTGEPGIRFYAGAPLLTPEGAALGTLCVIDRVPRKLNTNQQMVLRILSEQVMKKLKIRRRRTDLGLDENDILPAGVHDFDLQQLENVIHTTPHRYALWLRLMTFLGWPILHQHFSYAFISGPILSSESHPYDIDVTLQLREPQSPNISAIIQPYLTLGRERIFEMFSVHLRFWSKDASLTSLDDTTFVRLDDPVLGDDAQTNAVVRLNLLATQVIGGFHKATDPFQGFESASS